MPSSPPSVHGAPTTFTPTGNPSGDLLTPLGRPGSSSPPPKASVSPTPTIP